MTQEATMYTCRKCGLLCETYLKAPPHVVMSFEKLSLCCNAVAEPVRARMVTLSKCPTPGCNNGIRASRETLCADCRAKQPEEAT